MRCFLILTLALIGSCGGSKKGNENYVLPPEQVVGSGNETENENDNGNSNEHNNGYIPIGYMPSQLNPGTILEECDWVEGEVMLDDICGKPKITLDKSDFLYWGREGSSSYLLKASVKTEPEFHQNFGVADSVAIFGYLKPEKNEDDENDHMRRHNHYYSLSGLTPYIRTIKFGHNYPSFKLYEMDLDIYGVKVEPQTFDLDEIKSICNEVYRQFSQLKKDENHTVRLRDGDAGYIAYCTFEQFRKIDEEKTFELDMQWQKSNDTGKLHFESISIH